MIDDEEYQRCVANEKSFLDTIDILNLINSKAFNDLYLLMDYIEDTYGELYQEEDYIFNWLDEYDFMQYLMERYPDENLHITEETTVRYTIN